MTKHDIVVCNIRKVQAIADLLGNLDSGGAVLDSSLQVIGEILLDYTTPILVALEESE